MNYLRTWMMTHLSMMRMNVCFSGYTKYVQNTQLETGSTASYLKIVFFFFPSKPRPLPCTFKGPKSAYLDETFLLSNLEVVEL